MTSTSFLKIDISQIKQEIFQNLWKVTRLIVTVATASQDYLVYYLLSFMSSPYRLFCRQETRSFFFFFCFFVFFNCSKRSILANVFNYCWLWWRFGQCKLIDIHSFVGTRVRCHVQSDLVNNKTLVVTTFSMQYTPTI